MKCKSYCVRILNIFTNFILQICKEKRSYKAFKLGSDLKINVR